MPNKKEKVLNSNDLHNKVDKKFTPESNISEKEKKIKAFILCEPGDLHIFCNGVQNVPNKFKKEYRDEDYDEKGNKL